MALQHSNINLLHTSILYLHSIVLCSVYATAFLFVSLSITRVSCRKSYLTVLNHPVTSSFTLSTLT